MSNDKKFYVRFDCYISEDYYVAGVYDESTREALEEDEREIATFLVPIPESVINEILNHYKQEK